MIHRLCLILVCVMLPCAVQAGAWPRAQGTAFVSIGGAQLSPKTGAEQQETTLYAELGLKNRYTLGISGSANMDSSGEGHLFLRFPPFERPNGALFAVELGYGAKTTDAVTFHQFAKLGLSWSKGVSLARKSGWLSIDGALLLDTDESDNRLKLDATLGVTITDRFTLIGQAFAEATQFGESLTLAPSLVFRPKEGATSYQLGFETKGGQETRTAFRFNVWTEF